MPVRDTAVALLRGVCAVLLVAGCATHAPQTSTSAAADAHKAAAKGNDARASQLYSNAAESAATPAKRDHWRIRAALAALDADEGDRAQRLLQPVAAGRLGNGDHALLDLAHTRLRTADQSPRTALDALAVPDANTPAPAAAAIWKARAELQFQTGNAVAGLDALVQRGHNLDGDAAQRANNDRILEHARAALRNDKSANASATQDSSATTRGWLSLVAIGERVYPSAEARQNALANWYARHPDHPASRRILAEQFGFSASAQASARRLGQGQATVDIAAPASKTVALAVPLSGSYKSAGRAVRDGMRFAYGMNSSGASRPLIWDTNQLSAAQIAQRARQKNVGVLVGPLQKPKVTKLGSGYGRVLTIALNHATKLIQRRNFVQFGLAPEDDARTAAARALARGFKRGLALVPDSERGQRLLAAFGDRLRAGGGTLVAKARYAPGGNDHSGPIRSLLGGYNSAKNRNPNAVDFIFVDATPRQGRLIHSQLRYYHAAGLPMVATSLVYSGQSQPDKDIDLNGVYFVDMPWVLGQGPTISQRRQAAKARFSDTATNYQRLFALGMDAWLLAHQTANAGLQAGKTFEGMTGLLALDASGEIRRRLAWAIFKNGRAKLLSMPVPPTTMASGATAAAGDGP